MRTVVLINGLPGAGKSTLARTLGRELGLPVFSKDEIKETHADVLGALPTDGRPQRDWNRALGAAASETIWTLLAASPIGAVCENFWPGRRDRLLVAAGLNRAGTTRPVEVWCDVPLKVARARFEDRDRHPIHGEQRDLDADWATWAAEAEPLGLGPVLWIDTSVPVDVPRLADQVRAQAAQGLPDAEPAGATVNLKPFPTVRLNGAQPD